MSGPVSSVLEHEVLGELRRKGLVVWLDKDATYTRFIDELSARQKPGDFLFDVVAFRGSFLELLFQLEPFGNGLEKPPLLIHLPGFNTDSVRQTPLLELYEAGACFQKALSTLIREAASSRVTPAEVEAFAARPSSLDEADAWLAAAISRNAFGLAAVLDELGPSLLAEALAEPNASLSARITSPADEQTLRAYLHKLVGLDDAWFAFVGEAKQRQGLDHVLAALAAWALCVEYVHDLKRPAHLPTLQRLRALSAPLVKACRELVTQLRRSSPEAYAQRADETETFLAEELGAMTPDDLGQVDTFREEENRVLAGAVEALGQGAWSKARAWCEARQGDKSFWLQRDETRRWAWALVAEAAEFGETLARHPRPFEGAESLEEAAERYAAGPFEVDRAHRRFEQKRLALLESRLPHFGPLREIVGALRKAHRDWADRLARDFARLCKERGFLPPASHQQRTLYEQVVHPLTLGGEKIAVLVIDAFRYEMATELVDELNATGAALAKSSNDPGISIDLKPRLAELPTITAVGMNALAPVAREGGRLVVAGLFQGFKTGEFTVRTPADRSRAMGERSVGKPALLLKLAEVCEASTPALIRQIKPHQLIVVHSKEIDDAGEANLGLTTFESTLRQIKAAWHHLQLAGVKHFVFTADHGFLLQDETTEVRPFGTKRDPQRRHVLDEHPRAEAGMVNVSLSSLGYEGLAGYLLFRDDTVAFATGTVGATFVHGGNSPQERIIPVLTVSQKRVESTSLAEYAIEVEPQPAVLGLHRIRLRVVFSKQTTASLGFAATRAIDVALRAPQQESVRVLVKEVTRPAELKAGHLHVPVDHAWSEVFFTLEGPADGRVRLEVYHPDKVEKVQAASPEEWYAVSGMQRSGGGTAASAPPPPPPPASWADAFADEDVRRVFVHLEKHGIITELEITNMLGSPRAFRRFSLEFEANKAKLPFLVHIDAGEGGKRYVREGDRLAMTSQRDREHIFERLRSGVVPERGLEAFAVGVERQRAEIARLLDLAKGGEGVFKFLRGGYGCGKTFMARLALLDAQARGFATSFVVVSDNDLHFHKFDDVYRKVVQELGTSSCPRGALSDIVDRWVARVEDALISGGADERAADFDQQVRKRIEEDIATHTGGKAPEDMGRVLREVFTLKQAGKVREAGALLSWLGGSENVAAAEKKAAGIKGDITSKDAMAYLHGIVEVIKAAGYAGLVIVIDEAETILRMRQDVRGKSLNGIRQIIDAADRYKGLLWVFTGTPEFFDNRRGVAGLQPLHDRIQFLTEGGLVTMRQPQLELRPFDRDRLKDVGLRLRELYPAGDPNIVAQKVTPERIVSLVDEVTKGFRGDVGVVPRQFLRRLVNLFDLVAENPDAALPPPPSTVEEARAAEGKKPYEFEPEPGDEKGYASASVEF